MFCSNCGNRLSEDAKFCSSCGARVAASVEPDVRPMGGIEFEEPKIAAEPEPESFGKTAEPAAAPSRPKMAFDWSNVVDEPQKKQIREIRSPWETTEGIDEKELYAEMTPSTDRSRTMGFIDVMKAEKAEKEKSAAKKAIEYTEVIPAAPDYSAFDEPPQLHYAPLYEDVDEPVKTPFDKPEGKKDVFSTEAFKDEPRFESGQEPKVEASRETIAQFDDYVKSFEKGAGIGREEPRLEEEENGGEASGGFGGFELPDFLKKAAGFGKNKAEEGSAFEEPAYKEPAAEEPAFEEPAYEEPAYEEPVFEEPAYEEPAYEEPIFEEPVYEEPAAEEPVFEEPVYEEPAYEEPVFEEPVYEEEAADEEAFKEPLYDEGAAETEDAAEAVSASYSSAEADMEDLYLDMDLESAEKELASDRAAEADPVYEAAEEIEEIEPIDEEALFREMSESKPEKKTGMTIAGPADTESEIESLKKRLAELMGNEEAEAEDAPEKPEFSFKTVEMTEVDALFEGPTEIREPEFADDDFDADADPEEGKRGFAFESIYTPPVDDIFDGATPGAHYSAEDAYLTDAEPAVIELEPVQPEPEEEAPSLIKLEAEPAFEPAPAVKPAAPAIEPEPAQAAAAETISAVPAETAPAAAVVTETPAEAAPVIEPEPVRAAAPEPVPAVETVPEPAPVVEVAPAAEEPAIVELEPAAVEPAAPAHEKKSSDALSLEDLERNLFGDELDDAAEAEETKKIDKFYTLYRKNEEFQRLLDEEYSKLKGETLPEEKKDETPVEKKKVYRPVEDETIYMPKEVIAEQEKAAMAAVAPASAPAVKAEPAAAPAAEKAPAAAEAKTPAGFAVDIGDTSKKSLTEVEPETVSYKKQTADDKKAAKEAAKAEKARKKAEKKLAKSKAPAAAGGDLVEEEYEEVDAGSGFLTALAVIIAVILVVLLAVILILQVAPDSSAAAWIDSLIENITGGFSMIDPTDGQFLL